MGSSLPSVISPIFKYLMYKQFNSVLDIGVGESGLWGFLLRDKLDGVMQGRKFRDTSTWTMKIIGIEIMPEYKTIVHQYCYDKILWMDVFDALDNLGERACDPKFDLIMMTAFIEHLDKERGYELLRRLKSFMLHGGLLVLATPNGYMLCNATENNPHDEHKCGWVLDDFKVMESQGWIIEASEVTYDDRLVVILKRK